MSVLPYQGWVECIELTLSSPSNPDDSHGWVLSIDLESMDELFWVECEFPCGLDEWMMLAVASSFEWWVEWAADELTIAPTPSWVGDGEMDGWRSPLIAWISNTMRMNELFGLIFEWVHQWLPSQQSDDFDSRWVPLCWGEAWWVMVRWVKLRWISQASRVEWFKLQRMSSVDRPAGEFWRDDRCWSLERWGWESPVSVISSAVRPELVFDMLSLMRGSSSRESWEKWESREFTRVTSV